jgi:hypothetical protein
MTLMFRGFEFGALIRNRASAALDMRALSVSMNRTAFFTSPRWGEVGMCARFAHIPGEGALGRPLPDGER